MTTHRVLSAAALALLLGCGDNGTEPSATSGTLSFSHSGAIAGTFSASGALNVVNPSQQYAVGVRDDQQGIVAVEAYVPRSGGTYDLVLLLIPRTTAGSVTIDENCTADCAEMYFSVGVNDATNTQVQECLLATGSITIGSISASRVQGSFSGTGTCVDASATENAITISGGAYNVALLSSTP